MSQHLDYSHEGLKPHIESLAKELVNNIAVKKIYKNFLGEEATDKTIFITVFFIISQAIKENLLFIKDNKKRVPDPYDAMENLDQLKNSLIKTERLIDGLGVYERDFIELQAKYSIKKQSTESMRVTLSAIQNQVSDTRNDILRLHPVKINNSRVHPYFSVVNCLYFHFKTLRFDISGITQLNPQRINNLKKIIKKEEIFFEVIITRVFHEIYDYFFHDKDNYNSDHSQVIRDLKNAFNQIN